MLIDWYPQDDYHLQARFRPSENQTVDDLIKMLKEDGGLTVRMYWKDGMKMSDTLLRMACRTFHLSHDKEMDTHGTEAGQQT